MGLYEILQWVGKVAYELKLYSELASVHSMFHVSMIKKYIGDPVSILTIEGLGFYENLSGSGWDPSLPSHEVEKQGGYLCKSSMEGPSCWGCNMGGWSQHDVPLPSSVYSLRLNIHLNWESIAWSWIWLVF